MFKTYTEEAASPSLVLLYDLQKQIRNYREMCEKLASMPKPKEQQDIDAAYGNKLKIAENSLINLQKNNDPTQDNNTAFTPRG